VPIEHRHQGGGDSTFGDAIMDRQPDHAHRITRTGGSLRKLGATSATDTPAPEPHSPIPRPLHHTRRHRTLAGMDRMP
jgi:hypothetical protein